MIKHGTQICFKAMSLSYNANVNEYHFKILEINMPFIIKGSKKVFKVGKSAMFRAICVYIDKPRISFTLNGYKSEPETIDLSGKFLSKSRMLHLLFFWRKC